MQNSHLKLHEIIWEITGKCNNKCEYCGSCKNKCVEIKINPEKMKERWDGWDKHDFKEDGEEFKLIPPMPKRLVYGVFPNQPDEVFIYAAPSDFSDKTYVYACPSDWGKHKSTFSTKTTTNNTDVYSKENENKTS